MLKKILVALFLLTSLALLIGARFGFAWAGGEGYETPMSASVKIYSDKGETETTAVRGELIKTNAGEKAIVQIGERIVVAVDERSDVVLEKLFPSEVKIVLRGGRVLAKTSNETEKLTISSPETSDFINSGAVTAVRYDSLSRTDIVPMSEFDWSNSTDRDFFLWAAEKMKIELE
ncbi:MAG: hypothetical protein WC702_00955 [Patescibacteria group bacterium]|jgi:hypothetical protein